MRGRRAVAVVRAALVCAALAVLGPARLSAAPGAASGTLPGGASYLLRPSTGAPVATIALWFRAPAGGFDSVPLLGIGRLAAAAVAASRPISGEPLVRAVESAGGRLSVAAYPESIAVSALVPAASAGTVVRAMTRAYFSPVLNGEGLAAAKTDQVSDAAVRRHNPDAVLSDALYAALFASGPAKFSTWGSPNDLAAIDIGRVRAYAERAFRATNAILVATGYVDANVLAEVVPGREDAPAGPEPALAKPVAPPAAPVNRSGDEPGFGLAWAGPPIDAEREATACDFIADLLFHPDAGTVQLAARASGTAITGTFVTFHDPGVFVLTATGGDLVAARAAIEAGLGAVRRPLGGAAFEAARRRFVYHLLSDEQNASGLADTLGWYAVEGDAQYAPGENGRGGRYFRTVDGLTPEFVAATAAKYLDRPGVAVVVSAEPGRT